MCVSTSRSTPNFSRPPHLRHAAAGLRHSRAPNGRANLSVSQDVQQRVPTNCSVDLCLTTALIPRAYLPNAGRHFMNRSSRCRVRLQSRQIDLRVYNGGVKQQRLAHPAPSGFRRYWRLAPGTVFLNHGSFGACPNPILKFQDRKSVV